MRLLSGLADHMVVQRGADDLGSIEFRAACDTNGNGAPVLARVWRDEQPLPDLDGVIVGEATEGLARGVFGGLATGGPYRVELRVGDETCTVSDILVGDVWILAGQSNMQGIGWCEYALPPHPQVRCFSMDDRWGVAQDPLHDLTIAVDLVHLDLCGGMRPPPRTFDFVGPGLAFGRDLQRRTGVPQGLLACAHGGSSMSQWDPKLAQKGQSCLYGAMLRRVRCNGSRVAGMLWYQGESDATPQAAPEYARRTRGLIRALRRDLGAPDLPVVAVQLGRLVGIPTLHDHWNDIQEQQRLLPHSVPRLAVVPAVDLPLDDCIHISGDGQRLLGERLADAMLHLLGHPSAPVGPIALQHLAVRTNPRSGLGEVVATFADVSGTLQAQGRPLGFDLRDPGGHDAIARIVLEGNTVVVRTILPTIDLVECQLAYGRGPNPVCTIGDSAGRSLPVFAPQPLHEARALTTFAQVWEVAAVILLDRGLAALDWATVAAIPQGERQRFPNRFCDVHHLLAAHGGECAVVMRAGFVCTEEMHLRLLLGYDGPVRAWVDGQLLHTDERARPPAIADRADPPFRAAAGEHTLVVALASHRGFSWGIYARLERLDVAKRVLRLDSGNYTMPVFHESD